MAPRKVLVVRHAESVWNARKKEFPDEADAYCEYLYTPDCNITERGKEQCVEAGVALKKQLGEEKYTLVLSPLRRAIQTADLMMESGEICKPECTIITPNAAEIMRDACDIGTPVSLLRKEFSHLPWDDNADRMTEEHWWSYGCSVEETWNRMRTPPHRIETDEMIRERISSLRGSIREQTTPIVVVVCHSETIWWLVAQTDPTKEIFAKNCEIVDVSAYILDEQR